MFSLNSTLYNVHVYTRIYTIGIILICFILLQTVVQAVAKSMTMTAQQVVKDEYGAEVSFFYHLSLLFLYLLKHVHTVHTLIILTTL